MGTPRRRLRSLVAMAWPLLGVAAAGGCGPADGASPPDLDGGGGGVPETPADGGADPLPHRDAGPAVLDPFDGMPGIEIGVGIEVTVEGEDGDEEVVQLRFQHLEDGAAVTLHVGPQGCARFRHVNLAMRGWNLSRERPPSSPDDPESEWPTALRLTTLRIRDAAGDTVAEVSALVRLWPEDGGPAASTDLISQVQVLCANFPDVLGAPVTLEVIRDTDDEPLSARVDDITLVPEPCDTPFECQRR